MGSTRITKPKIKEAPPKKVTAKKAPVVPPNYEELSFKERFPNAFDAKGLFKKGHGNSFFKGIGLFKKTFITTPEQLREKMEEYIIETVTHPMELPEIIKGGDMAGSVRYLKTDRPLSTKDFCVFCGMSYSWYKKLKFDNKDNEDFQENFDWFKNVCDTQVFNFGMVNKMNAAMVMKHLKMNEDDEEDGGLLGGGSDGGTITVKIVKASD